VKKKQLPWGLPLAVMGISVWFASCGPSDPTETVAFVLSINSKRITRIEFDVSASSGNFTKDDGGCDPSDAVQRNVSTVRTVVVDADGSIDRGVTPTSSSSTSSVTVPTTLAPVTTTLAPATTSTTEEPVTTTTTTTTSTTRTTTTTTSSTTTTVPLTCGNGSDDANEECDDGDRNDGDGCDSTCHREFQAVADDTELTIRISKPTGIAPGTTLAFCRFQGDPDGVTFDITTRSCALASGGNCTATDATVTVSTTTTTTTTTTSTTLAEVGADCDASAQCKSGFCVDDVCCESICTGLCQGCASDLTDDEDGQCTSITSGQDPDDECTGVQVCSNGFCQ
jgi:cysteine-rich repeat protein